MKKNILLFFSLWALLLGVSCTPVYVAYVDQGSSSDFTNLKTFDFYQTSVESRTDLVPHESNLEKIKKAISAEMIKRGYSQQLEKPDLLINIGVIIDKGVTTRETTVRDAPIYTGQRNYHWQSEEVVVDTYDEGSIIVDIVDAGDKQLIWEGVVKGSISKNQAKNENRINKGIENLFKEYPIQP